MVDNDIVARIERMIEEYILAEGHPPDRLVTSREFMLCLKKETGDMIVTRIGGIFLLWTGCVTSNTVYLLNKDETVGVGEIVLGPSRPEDDIPF